MFNLINQNSLLIVSVLLSIIVSLIIWKQFGYKWSITSTVISIMLIGGLLFLTSTRSNKIETIDQFNLALATSTPILIYVYSDWWIACTAAKPTVSRLETSLSNACKVLRVDVSSDVGRHVWDEYKVGSVPTFILISNQKAIWQTEGNVPKSNNIRKKIAENT